MKASLFSYDMHDGPTAFSIELAGILAAEGANKLEQDWRDASAAIGNKELVVDLSFLTEIDPQINRPPCSSAPSDPRLRLPAGKTMSLV